jgi:hypothetical protein
MDILKGIEMLLQAKYCGEMFERENKNKTDCLNVCLWGWTSVCDSCYRQTLRELGKVEFKSKNQHKGWSGGVNQQYPQRERK